MRRLGGWLTGCSTVLAKIDNGLQIANRLPAFLSYSDQFAMER